ncbi:OmpA/MotB family protein [Oceanibacterium hippocampi]|uniref:Motility protein B n=1 Tax=Oceanibacterium hippocampi TaxID=745714 RepID=A0A1Y5TYN3_9PROT|nr:flagellar motor protein MotB [Oceanibacterium hippocampi]SLN77124.1 Motility protein B [Oceanibacterium hippocampi]
MDERAPNQKLPGPMDAPWLITFADLLSLMLTFFVLLYSMSEVKADAWRQVVQALSSRDAEIDSEVHVGPTSRDNVSTTAVEYATDLSYLESLLAEKITGEPLLAGARVERGEDRVVVSLPGAILFGAGEASVNDKVMSVAAVLSYVLRLVPNRIEIQGHTDPDPVSGAGAFASNWELSLARALAVENAFRRTGYRRPIGVLGLADSQFFRLPGNLPLEERYERARRVDVVVRADK